MKRNISLDDSEKLMNCTQLVQTLRLIHEGKSTLDDTYTFARVFTGDGTWIYSIHFTQCHLKLQPRYFGMHTNTLQSIMQCMDHSDPVLNERGIPFALDLLESYMKKRFGVKPVEHLFPKPPPYLWQCSLSKKEQHATS